MGRQFCFVPFVDVLIITLACSSSMFYAKVVEHTFHVGNMTTRKMCQERTIIAVNGSLPGPTIQVNEGDTLIVHVFNKSPYDVTIHWHGVFQLFSAWADGPEYATQCPIKPGNKYTYKFKVTKQEGTMWWHAHTSYMRATVYGALIIRPRLGRKYPFPKPYREVPIMLGEWWNGNVMDLERISMITGGSLNLSDAYSINGRLGDLYPCSRKHTYNLKVMPGKTYLLRIIDATLSTQHFFKIANHKFTVVAIDASYTEPYHTDVVVVAPGQTVDVLMDTNQPMADYYMAARPYISAAFTGQFSDDTTTTGIVRYIGSPTKKSTPIMPTLPALNDTETAHKFYTNLTGLTTGRFSVPVPRNPDEKMFITFGLGISLCGTPNGCIDSPFGPMISFAASMNNHSFQLPTSTSMLEAFVKGVKGVYTEDFPDHPPLKFDYTTKANVRSPLWMTEKSTRVKRLKFNSTVEIVLQNTALLLPENHPMHLHGFNFHVLAQGFGNYNNKKDSKEFNFVNPQERNTIAVPTAGWAVIRFRANNPGVWMMHCHLDSHMQLGLAMAFVVENGPTPSTSLPPPPADLPRCSLHETNDFLTPF